MIWERWFGADVGWRRPRPARSRQDAVLPLVLFAVNCLMLELTRSVTDFSDAQPVWVEYLLLGLGALLLAARRHRPLTVASASLVLFIVAGTFVPEIGYQFTFQVLIFVGVYSGVAWGSDRRATARAAAAMCVGMVAWIVWDFVLNRGIEHFQAGIQTTKLDGLLPAVAAFVLLTMLSNIIYLGGALVLGQTAWRQALDQQRLAEQTETIEQQAAGLRDQAVTDERLRIARELHDVVAHHVSVMGIQAAGARRMLERDPATAALALENVEHASREAVSQMRNLLGALREVGGGSALNPGRLPQPTLAELPALFDSFRDSGLVVEAEVVMDPSDGVERVPLPVQLSVYRTVQEALTNVRRHSTAEKARVRVEVLVAPGGHADVEVLDDGTSRGDTSSSGLGLVGMRERVNSHGGQIETGPRPEGGFRVWARFPLASA